MSKIEKPEQLSDKIKDKLARGGRELTSDERIQVLLHGWDRPPLTYEEIADELVKNCSYAEVLRVAERYAPRLGLTKKDFLDRWRGYKR